MPRYMPRDIPEDFVRMGKHQCPVCLVIHDSGEILLHTRFQSIPENKTLTGYGPCDPCKDLYERGFIALVEADNPDLGEDTLTNQEAIRTGRVMHIKREAAEHMLNIDLTNRPMAFIRPGVLELIAKEYEQATGEKLDIPAIPVKH